MTEWTEYISTYYNENKKEILFTYNEYKKNPSNNIVKLFRFYPDNNEEEKYLIKYKGSNIWDKDEFENYFEKDDQIILIKKNEKEFETVLKRDKIKFNGCYDYNEDNQILIP